MTTYWATLLIASAAFGLTLLSAAKSSGIVASFFRVLRRWACGQSRTPDVLDLAVRLRLLMDRENLVAVRPVFWVRSELRMMPESTLLDLCCAYGDLARAGLPHQQILERLEIWRSRCHTSSRDLSYENLADYLRSRMSVEWTGYGKLPYALYSVLRRLFMLHWRLRSWHHRRRMARHEEFLLRPLYQIRIENQEVSLVDGGVKRPIGWTDLEIYLESDQVAVRAVDGDVIWTYSANRSAGLALIRDGRVVELAAFAEPVGSRTLRRRSGSSLH